MVDSMVARMVATAVDMKVVWRALMKVAKMVARMDDY